MDELSTLEKLAIWVLPVLLAITVHEVAHGWVARALGDNTASRLGRLSLNPIRHVDPVGTLLVPGVLMFVGGVMFGWAKPVPVAAANLRNPHRDMALVAVAGPLSNLVMATGWAVVVKLSVWGLESHTWLAQPLIFIGVAGIFINTILLAVNLLPLPPLDGGRVLVGVLPLGAARWLTRIEPYGMIVLLLLLFSGGLGTLVRPLFTAVESVMSNLAGLPVNIIEDVLILLI